MGIRNLSTASISTGAKRSKFWDQSTVLSASSYESISTVTVGAGGSATVTFSSIPATYTHLQIRGIMRAGQTDTGRNMFMQYNGDTGANYNWHYFDGDGTSVTGSGAANQNQMLCGRMNAASAPASSFGVIIIDILDYANTNKYKTFRAITGAERNGGGVVRFDSGTWRSTSAINSVNFYVSDSDSFQQYSQLALYGIKGA
jgi:hypothetical protein